MIESYLRANKMFVDYNEVSPELHSILIKMYSPRKQMVKDLISFNYIPYTTV